VISKFPTYLLLIFFSVAFIGEGNREWKSQFFNDHNSNYNPDIMLVYIYVYIPTLKQSAMNLNWQFFLFIFPMDYWYTLDYSYSIFYNIFSAYQVSSIGLLVFVNLTNNYNNIISTFNPLFKYCNFSTITYIHLIVGLPSSFYRAIIICCMFIIPFTILYVILLHLCFISKIIFFMLATFTFIIIYSATFWEVLFHLIFYYELFLYFEKSSFV
jgi:hypothetical protein